MDSSGESGAFFWALIDARLYRSLSPLSEDRGMIMHKFEGIFTPWDAEGCHRSPFLPVEYFALDVGHFMIVQVLWFDIFRIFIDCIC